MSFADRRCNVQTVSHACRLEHRYMTHPMLTSIYCHDDTPHAATLEEITYNHDDIHSQDERFRAQAVTDPVK